MEASRQGRRVQVEVVERKRAPGSWTVEAIDYLNDGSIEQAVFIGPDAQARCEEYAEIKYSLKTPLRHQSHQRMSAAESGCLR